MCCRSHEKLVKGITKGAAVTSRFIIVLGGWLDWVLGLQAMDKDLDFCRCEYAQYTLDVRATDTWICAMLINLLAGNRQDMTKPSRITAATSLALVLGGCFWAPPRRTVQRFRSNEV